MMMMMMMRGWWWAVVVVMIMRIASVYQSPYNTATREKGCLIHCV